jgi:hypothetical protein
LTSGEFVDNVVAELGPTFGSGFGGNWFAGWDGDGDVDRQDTAVAAGFWEGAIGLALAPGQVARIGDRTEAFWNLLKSNSDLPLLGNASFGPRTRASSDQYSLRFQSVDATPLISSDREEDVANEVSEEDLLHGRTEELDVGPLAKRRVPEIDRAAL